MEKNQWRLKSSLALIRKLKNGPFLLFSKYKHKIAILSRILTPQKVKKEDFNRHPFFFPVACKWSSLCMGKKDFLLFLVCRSPGDFITKVKQINSQSDLISMSSFVGPSYLTVRSFVCFILIWDPYICDLHNLCQAASSCIRRKPHQQWALNFNEQILKVHFLLLQPSISPIPAQVILLWKGPPKRCIEGHFVPLWAFPPKSPGSLLSETKIFWVQCNWMVSISLISEA